MNIVWSTEKISSSPKVSFARNGRDPYIAFSNQIIEFSISLDECKVSFQRPDWSRDIQLDPDLPRDTDWQVVSYSGLP